MYFLQFPDQYYVDPKYGPMHVYQCQDCDITKYKTSEMPTFNLTLDVVPHSVCLMCKKLRIICITNKVQETADIIFKKYKNAVIHEIYYKDNAALFIELK